MQKPHLLISALLVTLTSAACSREETRQQAREIASDARAAASRAGEQLADSWLTTKIQAQYFADDDIKARHINVSTRDGVAVLTGYVDDQRARDQAVQIARNTDGVSQVQDRLTIGREPAAFASNDDRDDGDAVPSSPDPGATSGAVATTGTGAGAATPVVTVDDQVITTRIQAKYFLDDTVKSRRIDVEAQNGVVTLQGEVASEAERAQALLLARTTDGVQRVEDSLAVNASLGSTPAATVDPAAATDGGIEPHDAPPEF